MVRRTQASFAALLVMWGCSAETSGPRAGPPAQVAVLSGPAVSAAAGAAAGTFSVKVTDAAGVPVQGVDVAFAATGSASVSPASAVSDASGIASTQVTLGTTAGTATVRASVAGVTAAATSAITVSAGPVTRIVITPKLVRLSVVGDTARIVAAAQDQFGNPAAASSVGAVWTSLDPTLVSVDQSGLVRALRAGGSTLVIASAGGRADSATVNVLGAGLSACAGLATAAPMAVGEIVTLSGGRYGCFAGSEAGAEYALVAFNNTLNPAVALTTNIVGTGLAAAPSALMAPPSGGAALLRSVTGDGPVAASRKTLDESFHLTLQESISRRFRGAIQHAVSARTATRPTTSTGGFTPSASRAAIPVTAQVGDLVQLNVSANSCTTPDYRAVRVAAIGSRSIVLADTLNPAGGFSTTDYQRFATRFDTLVYPLDVDAFGAPADIDNNGKVAILFTRAVNELVDSTSGYFVGGFFHPRDLFPKVGPTRSEDCAGSNEGEMFYMLVPAPNGIRGVKHTAGFVDSLATGVISHEFQHLINGSRRIYITHANDFEEVWLNEGLSHIAEELLYYRESGKAPRQNLDDNAIRVNSRSTYPFWRNDASANFNRFQAYIASPGNNSPIANDDELATRGATWAFLRYAADRLQTTDGAIWQRFTNSTATGVGTLQAALGSTPLPLIHDWAVANYLDDLGIPVDKRYEHLSWNYRHIYANTYGQVDAANVFRPRGYYPLRVTLLPDATPISLLVRGATASYVKFAVGAGTDGLLSFSAGGGGPFADMQFIVIRTK